MGAAAAAALAVPAGAVATTPPKVETSPAQRAIAEVAERRPACGRPYFPGASIVDTQPSAELTGQLAVLRGPQTAEDAAALERVARLPFGPYLRGTSKTVQAADGRVYDLVVAAAVPSQRPAACERLERRALRRVSRGLARAARRAAAEQLARFHASRSLDERVLMLGGEPGGPYGGGGGLTAAQVRAGQVLMGAQGFTAGPTLVWGIVRDGAATVTLVLADGRGITLPVQDNVVSGEIPGSPFGVGPGARTIVRDAAGAVLSDVTAPSG
jgi:hypothetical protein